MTIFLSGIKLGEIFLWLLRAGMLNGIRGKFMRQGEGGEADELICK